MGGSAWPIWSTPPERMGVLIISARSAENQEPVPEDQMIPCTSSFPLSSSSAFLRWLRAFFSSALSSAKVLPLPGSRKTGS